ncbi:MAG: CCA tRNA nucleotidyltransferase, partial [Anaerolineaceae bacterium]|nr:CCA tRNA nucleotidyltransferase [Anaerolineaceae bacterium]
NTMALRLDGRHYGNLYDYWAGLNDLRSRLVRVLHSLSFVDDPTRLLRAVRFEQRFGFNIEERTIQLMAEARPLLLKVSGDRIRHELNLMLQESNPFAQLQRLQDLELLSSIHPGFTWQPEFTARVQPVLHTLPEPAWKLLAMVGNVPTRLAMIYLTWFSQIPAAAAIETAQRLRFPAPLQTALAEMAELDHVLPTLTGLPPSQIAQRLERFSRLAMYAHHMRIPGTPEKQLLENFIRKWQHIQPITNGNRLKELRVPPGPTYRFILGRLRAAWLDGQVSNAEQEAALLEQLLTADVELDSP